MLLLHAILDISAVLLLYARNNVYLSTSSNIYNLLQLFTNTINSVLLYIWCIFMRHIPIMFVPNRFIMPVDVMHMQRGIAFSDLVCVLSVCITDVYGMLRTSDSMWYWCNSHYGPDSYYGCGCNSSCYDRS